MQLATINERYRELRLKQVPKKSQRAFGEPIGLTLDAVANIEYSRVAPSETLIKLTCKVYGVRRQWLEDGIGPMYQPEDEDDEIVDTVLAGEDEFVKAVIRGIAKTPGGWEKMREVFNAIQAELDKQKETGSQ